MVLPVDTDILRMRIQKDLEARYRTEIETRNLELERMTDTYYECKRHMEIYKTSLENFKYETEKIRTEIEEKRKLEVNELIQHNHDLQLRLSETRDKDQVRQVRRDLDEYKKRYSDASHEFNEQRKESESLKLERNDQIIKHAKEMEEETNERRVLNTENEKLRFRVKCLEDDLQKQSLKTEKKI